MAEFIQLEVPWDRPNKCEACDRFDECYMIGIGMKNLCHDDSGRNLIFKRKEEYYDHRNKI